MAGGFPQNQPCNLQTTFHIFISPLILELTKTSKPH